MQALFVRDGEFFQVSNRFGEPDHVFQSPPAKKKTGKQKSAGPKKNFRRRRGGPGSSKPTPTPVEEAEEDAPKADSESAPRGVKARDMNMRNAFES